MRPKVLLSAAAAALVLAACAADSTGPGTPRQPAPPSAEAGTGMMGSGGATPPDTTPPRP
jgi:hypothetical protein